MPNWVVDRKKGFTLALDVSIDDDLYLEGMARDIVHDLNYMRKLLGIAYNDYIIVEWMAPGRPKDAMHRHEKYIMDEAHISHLIEDFGPGYPLGEIVQTFRVGTGHKRITLGIKKDTMRSSHE